MGNTSNEQQPEPEEMRPAEALVAVNVDASGVRAEEIVRILEECGAHQVETAEGEWADGEWSDFDPLSMPHLVGGPDLDTRGTDIPAQR